jgi:hypothetical protein
MWRWCVRLNWMHRIAKSFVAVVTVLEFLRPAVMMDSAQSKEGLKLDSCNSNHDGIARYHYSH